MRTALRALPLALVLVGLGMQHAHAPGFKTDYCDQLQKTPTDANLVIPCLMERLLQLMAGVDKSPQRKAAVARPEAFVERLLNAYSTVQNGEPTEGGKMTRTAWVGWKAPDAGRIVIHTYGSEVWEDGDFDPLIAVYRGTALSNLVRITGNDNRRLPGISSVDSLVQFDTVADTNYRVQVGSKDEVGGEFSLNVFRFPPGGGLSAFLIYYGDDTNPFNGRDYSCDFTVGPSVTTTCPSAKFIVHNSSDRRLKVTASSDLGAGVAASPASFFLPSGGLKVVDFTFGEDFNHTKVRTVSGDFIFTGRLNGKMVTQARHRALVIARSSSPVTDLIVSKATKQVQTANTNEPVDFTVTITNKGEEKAIGCHFRSELFSNLASGFRQVNPGTGAQIGADNAPTNIAPGQTRTFKVTVASQESRDADFFEPEVIADCANNERGPQVPLTLLGGFDISASALARPLSSLKIHDITPAGATLNVPAEGSAFFKFRATNTQAGEKLDVLPAYAEPFEDPADSKFTVAICQTNLSTGACLKPYAGSVTYNAKKNTPFGFSVRVKAPNGDPAFDPHKRRVIVNFKQTDAPFSHIAVPSIAVRKID